jgi:adsorption protein B
VPDLLFAWLAIPLAVYICISGLDDLWMDVWWAWRGSRRRMPGEGNRREGRIAVWVACWREHAVLEQMLRHNLSAIGDAEFDLFVGVYPNDPETVSAAERAGAENSRVHVAEVPHDGPTSKADCLNWIYQRMLLAEESFGRKYELVVIHDAEDLVHPQSLERIRRAAGAGYGMIQVPVLALPTPLRELTHGLYCDDFAESQSKDLASRVEMGGFLPGCGVGTGFTREVLDRLASSSSNQLFDPTSLTEDYDNGVRVFGCGVKQIFLPLEWIDGSPVATREYFPRTLGAAVRQRSRWVTGNSLQAWERFGWGRGLRGAWVQRYFFWRDRKGLWGAPAGLVSSLLLGYGGWQAMAGERSWFEAALEAAPALEALSWVNGFFLLERTLVRMAVSARIYGWGVAALSPVRTLWGNALNSAACARALTGWVRWRWMGVPLRWVKTEHAYPNREALAAHRRKLGEILVGDGYCAAEIVEHALAFKGEELLGEYLVENGLISSSDLCEALCLQQGLPMTRLEGLTVRVDEARSLPERLQREHGLVVMEARGGELHVAGAAPPTPELMARIGRYTRLRVRYWLAPVEDIRRVRATLQSRS